jgi:hypothetical protein
LHQKTRYSISSIDNFYKAGVVPHDYGFVIDKDVGGLPLEIFMLEKNEINVTVFQCRHPNFHSQNVDKILENVEFLWTAIGRVLVHSVGVRCTLQGICRGWPT